MTSSSSLFLLFATLVLCVLSASSSSSSSSFVSARGFFYQVICADSACSTDCQYTLFQEDACYSMTNGQSGYAQCVNSRQQLMQENYPFSQNCTGLSNSDMLVSGKCYQSGNQYVKFDCNTGNADSNSNSADNSNSDDRQQQQQQQQQSKSLSVRGPPRLHRALSSIKKNNNGEAKTFSTGRKFIAKRN